MQIDLNSARPGMVLTEEVILPGSAGTIEKSPPLTNESIFRLKSAGVGTIEVRSIVPPYDLPGSTAPTEDGESPDAAGIETESIAAINAPLPPRLDIAIAPDAMSARLTIVPSGPVSEEITVELLQSAIRQSGILCGVREELLPEIVGNWNTEKKTWIFEGVARGTPARAGGNGSVEFLFNTQSSLSPKVNPDGTVDYREVNIYIPVGKGKVLARLRPPGRGTPGSTLFGDVVPCTDGLPATLPAGPNTEANSDGDLIAAIDGVVRYANGVVEVFEGFVIDGDVDFSTGNIRYDKSVLVKGDIKPGFRVECGGDLQVDGIIEDCTLQVGGSVLCKHGFIGQGKGLLDAAGDVNLGFIMNQKVKSRKSVNIARESINSEIYAQEAITLHGKPLSAAGGTLMARESISLWSVGNHTGVRTHLEVGSDFSLLEALIQNEEGEHALKAKHYEYSELVNKYRRFAAIHKHLTASEQLLVKKLEDAIEDLNRQLAALYARREDIRSRLYEIEHAYIAIEHAALPGSVFKIGEQRYEAETEVVGPKTVRLLHHAIGIF